MRLAAILLVLALHAGAAFGHALQPGFLEMQALGGDAWRTFWKVPAIPTGPLPIQAVLPETCDPRSREAVAFDGAAFVTEWVATCPGGIEGGTIRIDGLERTQTDVLLRLEIRPGEVETHRLTASATSLVIPAPQGLAGVFAAYLPLGITHILEGADHLMFVFALILLVPDRRRLVGAVTAFTVAHSLSLAAAVLGWLFIPATPVEAMVALSIMFLAAELLRPAGAATTLTQRWPWIVAFAFGLLHGLGFAAALLEVGLPGDAVPSALLAFNLGVEAGQLLFIALVLTVGVVLSRLYPVAMAAVRRPGGPGIGAASYLMGSVAAFWFVGRVASF